MRTYYEVPVSPTAVEAIYRHALLTDALLAELEVVDAPDHLRAAAHALGYPT